MVDSVARRTKGLRNRNIGLTNTEIPPVALDVEQFKRVTVNIIDNAIQATEAKADYYFLKCL